jgi:phospholipid/cholesterol/gamma-HCH transport system permease protein
MAHAIAARNQARVLPFKSAHPGLDIVRAEMEKMPEPSINHHRAPDGAEHVEISGRWNLRTTRERTGALLSELARVSSSGTHWDLTRVDELDVAGATLLWRTWQQRRPPELMVRPEDERIFQQLASLPDGGTPFARSIDVAWPLLELGTAVRSSASHALGMLTLVGQIVIWGVRLLRSPRQFPLTETSAAVFSSGAQALPITALVGFLIGIVLSYLSAEQLRDLGADSLIINLLGLTILRELGPLLAAILNAGRSGSSMTAQIGVMRVTNELEAMAVLGISPALRLVLPKILGQMIALPLVVLWTDLLAIVGGMLGAKWQLGISYSTFLHRLPQVVPLTSLWFGVCKGALFGALIALVACYFGLRIRPDTRGLAAGTTQSVVTALTLVLLVDAVLAVAFAHMGV